MADHPDDNPAHDPLDPGHDPSPGRHDNQHAHNGNGRHRRHRKRQRHKRRWLLRTAVVLGVLLLLVVIGVQAVLASELPKSLVLAALQKSLGLKAEAASVRTGWWGHTTVNDVKLSIPLDEGTFLETKQIRVNHTSLLKILVFGLEIKDLQVDQPVVNLRQRQSGRWNVADLVDGLARGGGGGGGAGGTGSGGAGGGAKDRPKIPAIDIRGATLRVTDRTGRASQVGPFDFLGLPDETAPDLVWKYSFQLPNQVSVVGRAVTGGDWRNEANIQVADLNPLLGPFVGNPLPALQLKARWEGRAGSGIEGRVAVEQLVTSGVTARGVLGVAQAGDKVTITPDNLQLFAGDSNAAKTAQATAVVAGGSVSYENGTARADKLVVRSGGGVAQVDGNFSPAGKTGEVSATWAGLGLPAAFTHDGTFQAKLGQDLTGRVQLAGHIDTTGHVTDKPNRGWAGRVDFGGNGPALDDLTVQVNFPKFTLASNRQSVPLDGLMFQVAASNRLGDRPGGVQQRLHPGLGVALEWARIGTTDRLAASGFVLAGNERKEWELKFRGSRWPLPLVDAEGLAWAVDVAGDREKVSIHEVRVAGAETVLRMTGSFEYSKPEPLSLTVELDHQPPDTTRETVAIGANPPAKKVVWGKLAARGGVYGTIDPVNLRAVGQLQGIGLKVFDRDLGDVSLKVRGTADAHLARLFRDPAAAPIQLLGGRWEVAGWHSFDLDSSEVDVGLADLPLAEVGQLMEMERLSGTAHGQWKVTVPTFQDVQHQVRLEGGAWATNVDVNGFVADLVDAKTTMQAGVFRLDPLEVRRLDGRFTGRAAIDVDDLKQLELTEIRLEKWPLQLPPSTYLTTDLTAPRVAVLFPDARSPDPAARKVRLESGPLVVQTDVRVGDVEAGTVRLTADAKGRVVNVPLIGAQLFGSETEGQATIDLDDPNNAHAVLAMRKVDTSQLAKLAPGLRSLTGSFDLDLAVGPSKNPAALEPLAANLTLTSRDAYWRQTAGPESARPDRPGIRVGDGRFRVLAKLDERFQPERIVLADQAGVGVRRDPDVCPPPRTGQLPVNTMEVAGGQLTFWGRRVVNEDDRSRPGFDTVSSHVRVGFQCLDLNQILQAFQPDGKPTPGLLDGDLILYGTNRSLETVQGTVTPPLARRAGAQTRATAPTTRPDDDFVTKLVRSMQGEGSVKLRRSDIGNIQIISGLYNAMRLGQDVRTPTGNGELRFRVENSNVYVTAFRFFNRGLEARGIGEVQDLSLLQNAPVRATVYGSIRTLADIKIPIVRSIVPDLDAIVSALQQNGTSIEATGTLGKPKVRVVLLGELGKSIRELLLGDYRDATQVPAQ